MNFSIDKSTISRALSKVQGITGKRTNLSITSDVLINAADNHITIRANDLETVFFGKYEADVKSEGTISINAGKLYEIIKEYPDEKVPINEVENRWVEIGRGEIVFNIVTSDWENFPETPVIENANFIETDSAELKKALEVTSCISFVQDEKRIYVLGVLLEKLDEAGEKKIRVVSTDSRRLHCYDIEYSGDIEFPQGDVLVPKKAFYEIGKFIQGVDGNISLGIKDNHLIVAKQDESLMIKLLDGEYPNYKGLLNTSVMKPVQTNRTMLMTMMRRMSILTSEDYKSIILKFENDRITATLTNPEIGESKDTLNISYHGEPVEGAYNPRYFIDALKGIENDDITLYIKDAKSPCLIKEMENEKLVCLIMAMQIS
ncbi:MAG: DNA polymerase III subunit beta [Desulfobacteraceae bacterium]